MILLSLFLMMPVQDFEFRREMAAGSRFAVRNIIGDIRIEGTSGRSVDVVATKKAGRRGDPDDVEIKAVETDGGVAICVYYPGRRARDDEWDGDRNRTRSHRGRSDDDVCQRRGYWNGDNNDTSVDFVVKVPSGLALDIKTVSGDVIGKALRGAAVDLGTVSGDLRVAGVEASSLEAQSVSGDVELADVVAGEVGAETVSGDVDFSGSLKGKGTYGFKTLSGDIVLALPGEPDAAMSATTFSGDLRSDFPVTKDGRRHRNRFKATWGAGAAELDLESFSGDIRIEKRP